MVCDRRVLVRVCGRRVGLPVESPAPLLLHFPLTLLHALRLADELQVCLS